jgi:hypothetical protein
MLQNDYNRLREAAQKFQERVEAARITFEEHVDLHRCVAEQNAESRSADDGKAIGAAARH